MSSARGDFGKRLDAAIKQSEIGRQGLARALGKSLKSVDRWCRGETSPDIALIGQIEKALGMEVGALHPGRPGDNGEAVVNRGSQHLPEVSKSQGTKERLEAAQLLARIQHDLAKLQLLLMGVDLKET